MPAVFGLIDQQANVIRSIEYSSKEYEKFYDSVITKAVGTAYEGVASDRVDEIIESAPLVITREFIEEKNWISGLIKFKLGIDGISILFIILTAFITPICIVSCINSVKKDLMSS